MKPQPFIPVGFSGKEFINRLRHSIEVMDFCPKRLVHNWVDYSEMIVIQAPPGTDCSQACRTKGLTCNAEMLSFINQKRFLTNFWQKCKNIIKITSRSYWSLGYPAINGQNCILQDNAKLLGCSVPGEGENRRVCPCQKQDLYEKMSD